MQISINNKIIANATNVIATEIQGLSSLYNVLDNNFIEIITLISHISGKIVLSGMGKSGHIARKIAATLSSTGSKAIFVHPGEASHGDLGMISSEDIVILLSNSGETSELRDITHFCKRFTIPIIAITMNVNSSLAELADFKIILPQVEECGNLAAPTTSTTLMLVLGDAIAITIAKQKNFTNKDFSLLHPGGKLGAMLTKVKDIMRTKNHLPLVYKHTLMSEVLITMSSKNLGCVGVIDNENILQGIITDGDLRRHMNNNLLQETASDIMTNNPITIDEHILAIESVNIMNARQITNLFVVSGDNKVVGLLNIHDCLKLGVK